MTKSVLQPGIIESLRKRGFDGFQTVEELWNCMNEVLPKKRGVYVFARDSRASPDFLPEGTGGTYQGKDPNVGIEELTHNWVEGAEVLYIGQTGGGGSKSTLHRRVADMIKFGRGQPVGHWGGRYIWQLADANLLQVCWKATPDDDPIEIEQCMIEEFLKHYGKRPFANLMG